MVGVYPHKLYQQVTPSGPLRQPKWDRPIWQVALTRSDSTGHVGRCPTADMNAMGRQLTFVSPEQEKALTQGAPLFLRVWPVRFPLEQTPILPCKKLA